MYRMVHLIPASFTSIHGVIKPISYFPNIFLGVHLNTCPKVCNSSDYFLYGLEAQNIKVYFYTKTYKNIFILYLISYISRQYNALPYIRIYVYYIAILYTQEEACLITLDRIFHHLLIILLSHS